MNFIKEIHRLFAQRKNGSSSTARESSLAGGRNHRFHLMHLDGAMDIRIENQVPVDMVLPTDGHAASRSFSTT